MLFCSVHFVHMHSFNLIKIFSFDIISIRYFPHMFSAVESFFVYIRSRLSCFCHRVCSRTRKPQTVLISNFFKVLRFSYFEHFCKHSVRSGHNSHKAMLKGVNKNLPLKLESSFAFFFFLRTNCYLDIKLVAFLQFPINANP